MPATDLNTFSLQDLKALQKDVEKAIKTFEEGQRNEALAAAEAAAREKGFSLNELMDTAAKPAKKSAPPKYRHPDSPALT